MKAEIAIHLYSPTLSKVRKSVQALAGRAHLPFEGQVFHGLIDTASLSYLIDDIRETKDDIVEINLTTNENGNRVVILPGTGVSFAITEAVNGALIYSKHSDLLNVETRF